MLHRFSRLVRARSLGINGQARQTSSNNQAAVEVRKSTFGWNRIAALLVGGSVGTFMLFESRRPEGQVWKTKSVKLLRWVPLRMTSRAWGKVNELTVPSFLRIPLFGLYSWLFKCNLDEMSRDSLREYTCLQDFFTRSLKEGARPVCSTGIASPVDGRVMTAGDIDAAGSALQIKGVSYTVEDLLGRELPQPEPGRKLFHCILYLAPGDYHGIHAPDDVELRKRTHIPGYLLPVAPLLVQRVRSLFANNERVVLEGLSNDGGYFAMVPVGASNVGSIRISHEPEFRTNYSEDSPTLGHVRMATYDQPWKVRRGEETAFFYLGSTVVLVFEADEAFSWKVGYGDYVKVGQCIGDQS